MSLQIQILIPALSSVGSLRGSMSDPFVIRPLLKPKPLYLSLTYIKLFFIPTAFAISSYPIFLSRRIGMIFSIKAVSSSAVSILRRPRVLPFAT